MSIAVSFIIDKSFFKSLCVLNFFTMSFVEAGSNGRTEPLCYIAKLYSSCYLYHKGNPNP